MAACKDSNYKEKPWVTESTAGSHWKHKTLTSTKIHFGCSTASKKLPPLKSWPHLVPVHPPSLNFLRSDTRIKSELHLSVASNDDSMLQTRHGNHWSFVARPPCLPSSFCSTPWMLQIGCQVPCFSPLPVDALGSTRQGIGGSMEMPHHWGSTIASGNDSDAPGLLPPERRGNRNRNKKYIKYDQRYTVKGTFKNP